ncbi:S8 family peptidase [Streptoalloteichus hindustanus]|uniref:Peptidase inhibitor I9 n=1 Tax=Streptoalloteichus hindustanus TaxID=2017 RepID=A0A1M4TF12_STRHI|nr:S8 family peptidase [Streptoalloteichus hindustanus]SHE42877.1 Peptidase inhibitor I9 [Streptoalloteichus hindustanus]
MEWIMRAARRSVGLGAATAAAVAVTLSGSLPAGADEGVIRAAGAAEPVKDSYIVVLRNDRVSAQSLQATVDGLVARHGGAVTHTYRSALHGYAAAMSEKQARRLAADPLVAYVEQDQVVRASTDQDDPPSWGLDRIDQRNLPLDNKYSYGNDGSGVNAYIIDTGIRTTHTDFGGRAKHGRDTVDNDNDATDCNGHGTHVAGTVGGTEHGVAKGVTLWAVRVLNCQGSGSFAGVIAGIDWVTANAVKPAVANMSLGGGASSATDDAVRKSIASGVTYAVAAGNGDAAGNAQDACTVTPARTKEAITVSATDKADTKPRWANIGTCVDLFAPGVGITSAWHTGDDATNTISGTSMATPHVAGVSALVLAADPSATPQQVSDKLVGESTPDVVKSPGRGTPNKLLYSAPGGDPGPKCSKTNTTDVQIPDGGSTVSSEITVTGCAGRAPAAAKVEVHIKHSYRGDLVIDLVTPGGAVKNLKQSTSWDSAKDVNETYTVDLSAENRDGTWKLQVKDLYQQDTGYLDSWSVSL